MNFSFCEADLGQIQTDVLALGLFAGAVGESSDYCALDGLLGGLLGQLTQEEGFLGTEGQNLLLHTHGRIGAKRLLLLGLGKREAFELPDLRRSAARAVAVAERTRCRQLTLLLPAIDPSATERASQLAAEGAMLGAYRFDRYRSEGKRKPHTLAQVQIALGQPALAAPPHLALSRAELATSAVMLARDLTNEPAGELTPTALSEFARTLAKDRGLECKVLTPQECKRQKMNLFLAVARGSAEEARFIHLIYRPKGREQPRKRFVLAGKGVTFDSGGLSLKPTESMLGMKADMAGAAAVIAVMGALPTLALQSEVHGLVAATENMPSGSAVHIGDVITGMGGKTVEIVNTDAEGRLTLADVLCYGARLQPDEIIDLATLTRACKIALGPHIAGVMGNNAAFVERFLAAGRRIGEDFWQLPLPKRLLRQLDSPIADLRNAGDRWGGALVAGLFLKEFVDDIPWVHVDLNGPATAEKTSDHIIEGATGFGVLTVLEYLSARDGDVL